MQVTYDSCIKKYVYLCFRVPDILSYTTPHFYTPDGFQYFPSVVGPVSHGVSSSPRTRPVPNPIPFHLLDPLTFIQIGLFSQPTTLVTLSYDFRPRVTSSRKTRSDA